MKSGFRLLVVGSGVGAFMAWAGFGAATPPPIPCVTPTVGNVTKLSTLLGQRAALTPGGSYTNIFIYGGDMGISTYTTDTSGNRQLKIIFGDTWSSASPGIPTAADDAQAIVCLTPSCGANSIASGTALEAYLTSQPAGDWTTKHGPPMTFPLNALGGFDPMTVHVHAQDPWPVNMGFGATPIAAFSTGRVPGAVGSGAPPTDFVLFQAWANDVTSGFAPTCPNKCPAPFSCVPRSSTDSTLLCVDTSALAYSLANKGAAEAQNVYVGYSLVSAVGSRGVPEDYQAIPWVTNKFRNPSTRVVNDFDPTRPTGSWANDYNPPTTTTTKSKLMIWGRSHFTVPSGAAGLYFAYVDLPLTYNAQNDIIWAPHYYVSTDPNTGVPVYSSDESKAAAIFGSYGPGGSPNEPIDIVNQTSIAWVEPLKQWVMFYGGDLWPAVSDVFGKASHAYPWMLARFAADPWGPFVNTGILHFEGYGLGTPSPPTQEYTNGGMLYSNACTGAGCAPPESFYTNGWFALTGLVPPQNPIGTPYAAEIIEPWTVAKTNPSGADIYSTISTFNPYGVNLIKTSITLAPFERRLSDNVVPGMPWNTTGGQWSMSDHDNDGHPDLVFIKTASTVNGKVEVHIAKGSATVGNQFQTSFPTVTNTTFANETDGFWTMANTGNADGDNKTELVFIKTPATSNVEVHVASSASNYVTRIDERVSGLAHGTPGDGVYTMADWDGDGKADLVYIKAVGTPSSYPEVHIASAASHYATVSLNAVTNIFQPTGPGNYFFLDYDGKGKPDLVFVSNAGGTNGDAIAWVATGESNFTDSFGTGTTYPAPSSPATGFWLMGDTDGNHVADLALLRQAPGTSGNIEALFASGN
jgi:hypothetical protein